MHVTSMLKMDAFLQVYASNSQGKTVLDVGSRAVRGGVYTYRTATDRSGLVYTGLDFEGGYNVDLVPANPYVWTEIADEQFDFVISGQAFEHNPFMWITFCEIARVLKQGGHAFIIAPSAGGVHRYPFDCWRYYPDSWAALCSLTGLTLTESIREPKLPDDIAGRKWADSAVVATKPVFDAQEIKDRFYGNLAEITAPFKARRYDVQPATLNAGLCFQKYLTLVAAPAKPSKRLAVRNGAPPQSQIAQATPAADRRARRAARAAARANQTDEPAEPSHAPAVSEFASHQQQMTRAMSPADRRARRAARMATRTNPAGEQADPSKRPAVSEFASHQQQTTRPMSLADRRAKRAARAAARAAGVEQQGSKVEQQVSKVEQQVSQVERQRATARHSIRRISRIAQLVRAHSYLEIGVSRGDTFNAIEFPRKVAVDPKFKFDLAEHRLSGIDFFEMTSDTFFANFSGPEKFDIIFIDGLHVFQQAYRDFCNSLRCSHDRTIFLIDDVVPIDEFSAIPDRGETLRRRRDAGIASKAWQGDVYKVIFAIHDFQPDYSFATINTGGNPQTVVWKKPREKVLPVFNSIEAIEQLSFGEFLQRQNVMNLRPEDEAIEMLAASIGRQGQAA